MPQINPLLVKVPARPKALMIVKSAPSNPPCKQLDGRQVFPLATPLSTYVPVQWSRERITTTNQFGPSWDSIRFSWPAQAGVYYEVQIATNGAGPWFHYQEVQSPTNAVVTSWLPVYCGQDRVVRVMR